MGPITQFIVHLWSEQANVGHDGDVESGGGATDINHGKQIILHKLVCDWTNQVLHGNGNGGIYSAHNNKAHRNFTLTQGLHSSSD